MILHENSPVRTGLFSQGIRACGGWNMNTEVPWSINGVDAEARAAATEAARRAGMALGDWLNSVIAEQAAENGLPPDDIGDDDRVAAVRSKLDRAPHSDHWQREGKRRSDAIHGLRERSAPATVQSDTFESFSGNSGQASPSSPPREVPFAHTRGAYTAYDRQDQPDSRPQPAAAERDLKRAILRLENRIEALGSREEIADSKVPADSEAPAYGAGLPVAASAMRSSDLARIEAKLNRLIDREAQPAALHAVPAYRETHTATGFGAPPVRRPMREAIAEINRRQADLDRKFTAGAPVIPPSNAYKMPASDFQSELKHTVITLKSEIGDLARHIDNLRHDNGKSHQAATYDNAAASMNSIAPEIEFLRNQIADVTAAIGKLAPPESLSALEAAIRDLGEQIAQSRQDGARDTLLAPVEHLIADMQRTFAELAPLSAVNAIEREIQAINRSIETMSKNGVDPELFARACAQTTEIRDLLAAAVARPVPLENIEKQLSSLAHRVDLIASRGATPAGVSAVHESVGEIRAAMREALPVSLLATLEKRIEELARKIDEAAARPDVNPQLDQITQRLDAMMRALWSQPANLQVSADARPLLPFGQLETISERLDSIQQTLAWQATHQPPAKVDTTLLESMLEQIITKINSPAPSSVMALPELESFETSLRDLSNRVDQLARQSDFEGLSGIEGRLAALSLRLEEPGRTDPSIAEMERTLNHLSLQLEENRLSAIDAASNAARSAARDVLDEFTRSGPGSQSPLNGAKELISQEINGLRSLQDASDRRTHATLGAVHETLEKVVDRLAMLEEEIGDERGSAPSPAASAHPDFTVTPARGVAPPVASPVQASATAPDVRAAQKDFLIEPGSGQRPPRNASAAISDPGGAGAGTQAPDESTPSPGPAANFIAAARRAQQAAQAMSELEAAQKPPARGGAALVPQNAMNEARERAKAAAALLSSALKKESNAGANEIASADAGEPVKQGKFFSGRKILLSLAGLVLIAGALNLIRLNMIKPAPPNAAASMTPATGQVAPRPAQTATAPLASPLSAAPVNTGEQFKTIPANPRAAGADLPGAFTPPPRESTSDGSPVGSIPTLAAAALPAGSNNLKEAAASGDARAQYELAVRMAEGRSQTRDAGAAAALLEKAVQAGLPPAQYRLGSLYEKGIGVAKDLDKARYLYEQAASAGNVKAMHNFAVLLAEGGAGKPDYPAAAIWFKRAAEHGIRDSQYNVAILYARGLGIEQNMVESYVWLALAEGQGDADAGSKRLDVEKRLTPAQLSNAKERVKQFRPQKANVAANEVVAPAGGWRNEGDSAQPEGAAAPAGNAARPRTPPARPPKVSAL